MTETVTPNIAHLKKVMTADQLIEFLADKLEAECQRADKAELELIKPLPIGELIQRLEGQTYEKWFSQSELKGEQVPVGEIVAWAGTDCEKGITREVDFRFLRFDVQPGTQLFTAPQLPEEPDFIALSKLLVENLVDCGAAEDSPIKQYEEFAYNACRSAMFFAAPKSGT